MKKAIIFILKSLGYFILALLLYVIIGYILSIIKIDEEPNAKDEVDIYILTNGMHTDIVVPTTTDIIDWSKFIKYEHTKVANNTYKYLALGWGDKGFYLNTPTWSDLTFSTAFKAASGLSTTAMHTTYYKNMMENDQCKKIKISTSQYKRLVHYIKESFLIQENGKFKHIITNANYSDTDAFYEAQGKYSLFKTCNSWANSALKESGQKAALWTALDTGIFNKYP